MSKENKIIRFNLEEEARQLRELGHSYTSIGKTLAKNHPKIKALQKLSPMSVMRFFDADEQRKIKEQVDQGGNPVKDLTEEFCGAVRDINERSEALYRRSIRILDKMETNNKDDALLLKAVKETRDSLAQLLKNMVALKQFGEKRSMNIQNINLKKEIHVKNMLMSFSRDLNEELCPNCRAKMPIILGKLENI